MRLTLVIQQGDDGPIRVAAAALEQTPRLLAQWQGGSAQPLRVRAVHQCPTAEVLLAAGEHRTHADWHTPAALQQITDTLGPGLPAIAAELDERARRTDDLRRLTGWSP